MPSKKSASQKIAPLSRAGRGTFPGTFEPKRVMGHFVAICKIPRPSGQEEKIREYFIAWAQGKNFNVRLDEAGNIAIDVPASAGCEKSPRVVLQGHMDMVCVGGNDKKATKLFVEGEWLTAEGTTLGADNGIGLAMALGIAEEKNVRHGPLTILITVDEEEGLSGAHNLGPELVPRDSAVLINLDSEDGVHYLCRGSAHGNLMLSSIVVTREELAGDYYVARIDLSGLKGGHSGVDIHEGRGNAIKLFGGLCHELLKKFPEVRMLRFDGGERSNVLPSRASCELAVLKEYEKNIASFVKSEGEKIKKSLGVHGKEVALTVSFSKAEAVSAAWSVDFTGRVLKFITTVADGPLKTVQKHKEKVLLSSSLGVVETDGEEVLFTILCRAAEEEDLRLLSEDIRGKLHEAQAMYIDENFFRGWEEPKNSLAVLSAISAYKKLFKKKEPTIYAVHAGLESAELQIRLEDLGYPRLPCVSFGPEIVNAHSVREACNIKSVGESFELLKAVLEELK